MSLIKCPECGILISDNIDACPNCGFPFDGMMLCPSCRVLINKGAKYCTYCGLNLNDDGFLNNDFNNNEFGNKNNEKILMQRRIIRVAIIVSVLIMAGLILIITCWPRNTNISKQMGPVEREIISFCNNDAVLLVSTLNDFHDNYVNSLYYNDAPDSLFDKWTNIVVPSYQKLYDLSKNVNFNSEELTSIFEKYNYVVDTYLDCINLILNTFYSSDPDTNKQAVASAAMGWEDARQSLREFRQDIFKIVTEYGITNEINSIYYQELLNSLIGLQEIPFRDEVYIDYSKPPIAEYLVSSISYDGKKTISIKGRFLNGSDSDVVFHWFLENDMKETVAEDEFFIESNKDNSFKKDIVLNTYNGQEDYYFWFHGSYYKQYEHYTISQLITDIEDNALRAKKLHLNEKVECVGYLSSVDGGGAYFSMNGGSNDWSLVGFYVNLKNDEQRTVISTLKRGAKITVRGTIIETGDELFNYYTLDCDDIILSK